MKLLTDNKGIALVTSLMLTLISLTIVMYLLLMVMSGAKTSGANKRYRTALEASYGGTEMILKEIIPIIFTTTLSSSLTNPSAALAGLYPSSFNFTSGTDACIMDKLTKPSSQWGTGCSTTSDPKITPDFSLRLNSASADTYTVYTKIVDSVCSDKRPYPTGKCTGSDLSGYEQLDGGQGTAAGSSGVNVQSMPATYRIEIVGEKTSNPKEKSHLSVLYAY
jgi:hypothetical protein